MNSDANAVCLMTTAPLVGACVKQQFNTSGLRKSPFYWKLFILHFTAGTQEQAHGSASDDDDDSDDGSAPATFQL